MSRYFVTVYARTSDDLRRLQKHSLDLFAQTAKQVDPSAEFGFTIEGLLETKDVEALVHDGYRVRVDDTVQARAHSEGQTLEFPEWLDKMKPLIKKDRAVRK